ncbi:hypothetical protein [Leifsonia sp. AG29]|uniref:hypothetical protein n=1 Tax=Leifsonia sp. AG29 TaxID=2598860 RepID=UPI00131B19A0|nr:hypothetical protein [Leifsonia sp. AG29]
MSWVSAAQALERRRKRLEARHEAAASAASPPAEHPVLGVGGRSLELSLGLGVPIDPNAFELAVQQLHDRVIRGDEALTMLREAAAWLSSLSDIDRMPPEATRMLREDLELLQHDLH